LERHVAADLLSLRSKKTINTGRQRALKADYFVTWCRLERCAFIMIIFASSHLLFYVVHICQKSFNFMAAFHGYKPKMQGIHRLAVT